MNNKYIDAVKHIGKSLEDSEFTYGEGIAVLGVVIETLVDCCPSESYKKAMLGALISGFQDILNKVNN